MVNYVKIGIETVFGTHVSTTGINAMSVNEDIDRGVIVEENIDNYIASAGYGGTLKISGSLEGNIRPKQLGYLLEALMGAPSPAGTYGLGIPKSLSLDVGEELYGKEFAYTGVGVSKLGMKFVAKDFATFTADWFAKDYVIGTLSAPTITAEDPAVFYNASVSFAGTASTKVKEISLDIDRKLDDDNFVLNDFKLHRLARTGVTDIGGTITFSEDEEDEYTRAVSGGKDLTTIDANNTLGSVALVITTTTMAGVTSMTITAPVAIYGKGGRKIDKVSEVEKTVDYKVVGSGFSIVVA